MRFFLMIWGFILGSLLAYGQEKTVCFTIDDLPTVPYSHRSLEEQQAITRDILGSLSAYEIPAIGFVNESKLYQDDEIVSEQVAMLEAWLNAGMTLGNHTFSHPSYHNTSFDLFTEDLLKGEEVTRPLAQRYQVPYKYFRHPFLHIGKSQERYDSLSAFLQEHEYIQAPVTIDNDDYLFALAYDRAMAAEDSALVEKIGSSYIEYMEQKIYYFEDQAESLFGRNISQILLIHASVLNAVYVDDLAEIFLQNGYRFVSLEEALKDTVFDTPITKFGSYGISWIDRWAISQGKKGDFFKGDPETPDFIKRLSADEEK